MNAPTNEIHDVFTVHSIDENGFPYSEMHEEIHPGSEGIVNPGANLAPHPVPVNGLHLEPGNTFVGSPTFANTNDFVMHTDKEDPPKPPAPNKPSDIPESTKDDRYQTHIVEVTHAKPDEEVQHNPHTPNTGKALQPAETITPEKTLHLENPSPHNEAEVDRVLADQKEHRNEAKQHQSEHHHHDEQHGTNEMHTNEAHEPQFHDHYSDDHHKRDGTVDYVSSKQNVANTTDKESSDNGVLFTDQDISPAEKNEVKTLTNHTKTESGKKRETTSLVPMDNDSSKVQEIGKILKNFDNVTKTLSDNIVKNAKKLKGASKKDSLGSKKDTEEDDMLSARADLIAEDHTTSNVKHIGSLLKKFDNETKSLSDNIVKNVHRVTGTKKDETFLNQWTMAQKDAYTQWRRKALINFHMRNPDKPIPRNTLSLSKNSLCPKFCRFFCDPWCVKIGCCTLSVEKLNIYKQIEDEQERIHPNSQMKPDTREGEVFKS